MSINLDNVTNIMLGNTPVEQVTDSHGNTLWSAAPVVLPNYFYVEDVSGSDNTLSIKKNNANAPTIEVFKSTDKVNWTSMGQTDTTGITATVPANGKLYLHCSTNALGTSTNYNAINTTGNCNVGGNIMSLLYGTNFTGEETTFPSGSSYIFKSLFTSNTYLIDASDLLLPATTLADGCYHSMFRNCTSLTTAPTLPATTLTNSCYHQMFRDCTSLTTAPALPATTLAQSCYVNMFYNCRALTTAPALPATTLAKSCYQSMFYGCTSLTTAPALPATTLAQSCYNNIFSSCSNLNNVTTYAEDISASGCLSYWLANVSATGDFYNLGGATYPSGASGIPSGWTEHTSL